MSYSTRELNYIDFTTMNSEDKSRLGQALQFAIENDFLIHIQAGIDTDNSWERISSIHMCEPYEVESESILFYRYPLYYLNMFPLELPI